MAHKAVDFRRRELALTGGKVAEIARRGLAQTLRVNFLLYGNTSY
jgi:hypothetical protein